MFQNRSFLLFPTNGFKLTIIRITSLGYFLSPSYLFQFRNQLFRCFLQIEMHSPLQKNSKHSKYTRSFPSGASGSFYTVIYVVTSKPQSSNLVINFDKMMQKEIVVIIVIKTFILLSYDVNKQKAFNGIQLLGIT